MSVELTHLPATLPNLPRPNRRRVSKTLVMWLRRGHLYLGLFLFPWAILYGVTAFLFNHPTAFSDQPTISFGREATLGTNLESLPTPSEQAAVVVAKLNELQNPAAPYRLAGEAKYGREFAFATVKADGQTLSVLFDVKNGGGTVRSASIVEKVEPEKAPFAVGAGVGGRERPAGAKSGRNGSARDSATKPEGIKLDSPLQDRLKAAVPTILERTGFPNGGEVTVTSVPDVVFPIEADGKIWTASYNSMTGVVAGAPAEAKKETEISIRRFLTKLHTAHGYPGEQNERWFWALVVDAMAFTMCFWGLTGLVMWWQIKATRKLGAIVLILSAAAATALGFAMHSAMTQ